MSEYNDKRRKFLAGEDATAKGIDGKGEDYSALGEYLSGIDEKKLTKRLEELQKREAEYQGHGDGTENYDVSDDSQEAQVKL